MTGFYGCKSALHCRASSFFFLVKQYQSFAGVDYGALTSLSGFLYGSICFTTTILEFHVNMTVWALASICRLSRVSRPKVGVDVSSSQPLSGDNNQACWYLW